MVTAAPARDGPRDGDARHRYRSRAAEVAAAMLVMYQHGRGTAVALLVDRLWYLPWLISVQLYIK